MSYATFFEIGGTVIESMMSSEGTPSTRPVVRPRQMKQAERAAITAVQELTGTEYDVARGVRGTRNIRTGATSVGTGLKIARWALAASLADGPLPVGDIIAAGILIGGGAYMIYEGQQDVRQR